MLNVIHFILDVLATSPEEFDLIASRLNRLSSSLSANGDVPISVTDSRPSSFLMQIPIS